MTNRELKALCSSRCSCDDLMEPEQCPALGVYRCFRPVECVTARFAWHPKVIPAEYPDEILDQDAELCDNLGNCAACDHDDEDKHCRTGMRLEDDI